MFFSIPPAIGLDISDTGLKSVWLKKTGKRISLRSFGSMRMDEGLIYRGEIREPRQVAVKIRSLLANGMSRKIYTNRVVVNLPETRTFIKVVDLAVDPAQKLEDSIRKEIEKHFPINVADTYLSWEILEENTPQRIKVLVGVAPKKMVENYLDMLELAGLKPVALEIEALALARSLINPGPLGVAEEPAKLIIDLGANRSSVIVYDSNTVKFSLSLPISGRQITSEIAQTLKLEWKQAEQVKLMCGLDQKRCQGALRELITLLLTDLIDRIQDSMTYYYDNFSNPHAVDKIIICGGGANLTGIKAHLSKALKLPVVSGNPFSNFRLKSRRQLGQFPTDKALQFSTAIGLALRGIEL